MLSKFPKSKVSIANLTFLTTFNSNSDNYYNKNINYDFHIFRLFWVRVG